MSQRDEDGPSRPQPHSGGAMMLDLEESWLPEITASSTHLIQQLLLARSSAAFF